VPTSKIRWKELCLALIKSESENEVVKILKEAGLWDDMQFWRSYGDTDNNWATANNQTGSAVGALVEILVNSGDANLIQKCRERGLDPDDWDNVPASINDAITEFYGIDNTKFYELTGRERAALAARSCGLVVTGSKETPNYGVYDFGEGQEPDKFPQTFLSINNSNKQGVRFVQGKFNQGSTGVLGYCGRHGLKLIVSRKNPKAGDVVDNRWGFTLIRRVKPSETVGTRVSQAFYLFVDGSVPSFVDDGVPVIPGSYPDAYNKDLAYGTYVKLFNFDIGPALRSQSQFDLSYKISTLLPKPILPVRVYERRKGYKSHSHETTIAGLLVRLEDLEYQDVGIPIAGQFSTALGLFEYKIYVLPEGVDKNNYSGNVGVIYTVNGQMHASLPRGFFRRKAVKMGYIDNAIIVLLDCSNLSAESIEELFQTSRDRVRDTAEAKEVERKVEEVVSGSQLLREINNQRRQKAIENTVQDNQLAQDVFKRIIKLSPALNEILILGNRLKAPFAPQNDEGEKAIPDLREFPTYFESKKPTSAKRPKECIAGAKSRLEFYTDAQNDYLSRVRDPGNINLLNEHDKPFNWNYSFSPNNGTWTLSVDVPDNSPIGQLVEITIIVNDVSRHQPLVEKICLKAVKAAKKGDPNPNPRPRNRRSIPKQPAINAQLPPIQEVYRDRWKEQGINFDESSGCCVMANDVGYDFYVNMDNKFLLTEMKNANVAESSLLKARFKFGLFLLAMTFVNSAMRDNTDPVETDGSEQIAPEEMVRKVTSRASMVILPLIEGLSKLDKEADDYS